MNYRRGRKVPEANRFGHKAGRLPAAAGIPALFFCAGAKKKPDPAAAETRFFENLVGTKRFELLTYAV